MSRISIALSKSGGMITKSRSIYQVGWWWIDWTCRRDRKIRWACRRWRREPWIQKDNEQKCESLKENVERDHHVEDFSTYFSEEEENGIKIKLVNGIYYVMKCKSDEWLENK